MSATATDSHGRAIKKVRRSMADGMSFSSQQLTVVVGEEADGKAKTFYAGSGVLAEHSEFFAAALRNGWKEKEERLVRLPECTAENFGIFLNFIHTGKIYSSKDDDYREDESDQTFSTDIEWQRLADCWVQGETLMSTTFKDAVADALVQKICEDDFWPIELHYQIYSRTSTPNSMSRLLVDIAIWEWNEESAKESRERHAECSEFLGDLAVRMFSLSLKERERPAPFTKHDCSYHEHGKEDTPCYKKIFN